MSKQTELERLTKGKEKMLSRGELTEVQEKRLKIITDRLEKITPKEKNTFFSKKDMKLD